jgi:predicted metal-dependent peptidase
MATEKETQLILSRAKIAMFETHPFYAHVLTKLRFEFVESLPGGAPSATDGLRIMLVPSAYLAASKGEQVTMLAHEQLHCLDGHLWRRGQRDALAANVAQDIYIYHILKSEGFATLRRNETVLQKLCASKGHKLDEFAGMFWEQIYATLFPHDPSPQQSGEGDGEGGDGDSYLDDCVGHCYAEPKTEQAKGEAREQWAQWIREAGMYAKMAGATAGRWQELVDAATPEVPFETRFFEHLKRGMGGDQTFDAFARRHIARGLYLPSEVVETMGRTVGVVDTSGSMDAQGDIAYALGVFRTWREQYACTFDLVQCDVEVAEWHTYEEHEPLPSQFVIKGRGGTAFNAPFEQVKERNIEPALLVYMTDGFNAGDLAPDPGYPVMWVLVGAYNRDFAPPYGEVVPVKLPKRR